MEHFATTAIELLLDTVAAKLEENASIENPPGTRHEPSQRTASRPKGDLG
eukprot:COSAG02_NODE_165_length_32175_cov_86.109490_22_plen_50_part_00